MSKLIETVEIHRDGGCEQFDVSQVELNPDFVGTLARKIKRICTDADRTYSFLFGWSVLFLTELDQDSQTRLLGAVASGEGVTAVWIDQWAPDETVVRFDRITGKPSEVTIHTTPAARTPEAPKPVELPATTIPTPSPEIQPAKPAKPTRRGRRANGAKRASSAPATVPEVPMPPQAAPAPTPRKTKSGGPIHDTKRQPSGRTMDKGVKADLPLTADGFVKWWGE